MTFDISQYETVHERLERFWKQHPAGRVHTELIAYSDTQYIFKAAIYKDANDTHPIATGYAEERVGSTFVNKTSAAENAETSAIGRSLANGGFVSASSGKPRASATEMQKTKRYETTTGSVEREQWKNTAEGAWADVGKVTAKQVTYVDGILRDACSATGIQYEDVFTHLTEWFGSKVQIKDVNDLTKKQASTIINDKRSESGQSSTKLKIFLHSKKDPNYDPWATPSS
jgi:hypothetical protein